MNTLITKDSPGINFAIPVDYVRGFFKQTIRRNHIKRCIGITMKKSDVDGHLVIEVFEVRKNSPAYLAGIFPGDILTHINDLRVKGKMEVYNTTKVEMETVAVLTLGRYSKTKAKCVRFKIEMELTPRLNCDCQVTMDYI